MLIEKWHEKRVLTLIRAEGTDAGHRKSVSQHKGMYTSYNKMVLTIIIGTGH